MAPDSLRLESVLVVLIDLAEGPLSSVRSMPSSELRGNAGALAEICALLEIPVLVARAPLPAHASMVLPEIAARVPHAIEVLHETNDCLETAAFVAAVHATGRTQLVFAGIATDVGVALTALSAKRAGYQAAVLADVCGTISLRAEQAALCRLNQAGVILTGWSAFAAEVQRNYTKGKGPQVLELVSRYVFAGTQMAWNEE